MNLKKPLELPVFFNTDETTRLENMGIDFDFSKFDVRPVWFLSVDVVQHYDMNGRELGKIFAGGSEWIINMSLDELKHLIFENI